MTSILWRRIDKPGHEACRLVETSSNRSLSGTAVFAHDDQPCSLSYVVRCNGEWLTEMATVTGWVGETAIDVTIDVDAGHRWRLNGVEVPAVDGCSDVDLNFSPSTNLLPIRRLNLEIGQQSVVRAAWLRFPSFRLELLEQVYHRLDARTYRYGSGGGSFVAELRVNEAGFVMNYLDFWIAETSGSRY